MNLLSDNFLGELSYCYGWVRDYTVQSFGNQVNVQLVIPCDEGDDIEDAQRAAFSAFDVDKEIYTRRAEAAIFDHYKTVCADYRKKLGAEFADTMAPAVTEINQMKNLVNATQVVIQQSFSSGDRIVGLLYSCTWEPELGLAVKFVNGSVDEVGPQDIVL